MEKCQNCNISKPKCICPTDLRRPLLQEISRATSNYFQVNVFRSEAKRARSVAAILARVDGAFSFPVIGEFFNRHHSGVIRDIAMVNEQIESGDEEWRTQINAVRARIKVEIHSGKLLPSHDYDVATFAVSSVSPEARRALREINIRLVSPSGAVEPAALRELPAITRALADRAAAKAPSEIEKLTAAVIKLTDVIEAIRLALTP